MAPSSSDTLFEVKFYGGSGVLKNNAIDAYLLIGKRELPRDSFLRPYGQA